MALMIRDGDYVPDGVGGLKRVSGREALLQRVLFKLTARRGAFPFREELGSRLWRLPRLPASQRPGAALQYVAEALEGEGLAVESVELTPLGEGAVSLTAVLARQGEPLSVSLDIR